MNVRSGIILICIVGCWTAHLGCGGEGVPTPQEGGQAGSIVQTAERGSVRMTVAVDKGEITLAERFNLTIEVTAEKGVDVEMPWFGGSLADFVIRDHREYPVEMFEGRWRRRQEYRLDVFLAGPYTIPDLTVTFTDGRAGGYSHAESQVTVSGFTVTVRSEMEGDIDPSAFRDIKGPVPLPAARTQQWVWRAGCGLAVVVGSIVLVVRVLRKRDRQVRDAVMSPHQWAFDQLQSLIDERLVERGLFPEFYFRLSMIVRRYIERRFGLMAPERTTEEFVWETQRTLKLPHRYRATVYSFLQACDMVKYARHAPQDDEIIKAIKAARDFVARSAEGEARRVTAA
ncbi:MAG: hypothetical protein JSU63_06930 [Phycisphaerales bacterium]|nr:MAG: hypothetical protein JSU63_06930 [Phycisphaerales bacterium]